MMTLARDVQLLKASASMPVTEGPITTFLRFLQLLKVDLGIVPLTLISASSSSLQLLKTCSPISKTVLGITIFFILH